MNNIIVQEAHPTNYGKQRKLSSIIGLVIHYVGSDSRGETVKNNLSYFANNSNLGASAHLFVDSNCVGKSVNLNREAYSVGRDYGHNSTYKGVFYGKLTNANTVSIEICDFYKLPLDEKTLANLIIAIKYVYKHCPNIKYIVRHYDVNGKECPKPIVNLVDYSQFLNQLIRGLL